MGNNKEGAGLGYKLVAVLVTLVVAACVFALTFSKKGNETTAVINAVIPVGSGLLVAILLGSIGRLSHKRWTIYLLILIAVAVYLMLRLYRVL